MGQPDEQSIERLRIGDIASLLGITVDSLPSDKRQLGTLVELTEALLEKNGEEWLRQNGDVILEQWEILLTSGYRVCLPKTYVPTWGIFRNVILQNLCWTRMVRYNCWEDGNGS